MRDFKEISKAPRPTWLPEFLFSGLEGLLPWGSDQRQWQRWCGEGQHTSRKLWPGGSATEKIRMEPKAWRQFPFTLGWGNVAITASVYSRLLTAQGANLPWPTGKWIKTLQAETAHPLYFRWINKFITNKFYEIGMIMSTLQVRKLRQEIVPKVTGLHLVWCSYLLHYVLWQ